MAEIDFAGERFAVADRIGLMPLMRFAKVAKAGADAGDMDSLAALYDLLEQCIAPADWHRFESAADTSRADGDTLMGVVGKVFAVLADRPTSLPSDSSDGQTSTPPNSADGSSSTVVSRLEHQGRPDLALLVSESQAARSAA